METELLSCEYLDEFRIIESIDSGTQSQVYKAVDKNGKLFAIKKYPRQTQNIESIRNEFQISEKLNHENLVKPIELRQKSIFKEANGRTSKCIALILQYIEGGSLFDFIANGGGAFPQKLTRTYFVQLLKCLHYLQKQGCVHLDIKPENILLNEQYNLKLIDFGFARLISDHNFEDQQITGTNGYIAPQIYDDQVIGNKADVFSTGVTLFVMYTGHPPFKSTDPQNMRTTYEYVREQNWEQFWTIFEQKLGRNFFSSTFKDLFEKMTCPDPDQRISIEQIQKHQWVKNQICDCQQIIQEFGNRKIKMQIKQKQQKLLQIQQNLQPKTETSSLHYYYVIGVVIIFLLSQIMIF